MIKKFYPSMFFFAAFVCAPLFSVNAAGQQTSRQTETTTIVEEAPTIALKGVDGKTYDLTEMHGNVVLVSFGATWCAPCVGELRVLEELKKEYKDQPVKFLWISLDPPQEVSDKQLRGYAKENKMSFPVLRDPTKMTYAQFSTRVRIPLVLLYNKEGTLVAKQFGMTASAEEYKTHLRARFDKLLAMQKAGTTTTKSARVK